MSVNSPESHFYITKLGYAGGIPNFLFFFLIHKYIVDSNVYPQSMFMSKNIKNNIQCFKMDIFAAVSFGFGE